MDNTSTNTTAAAEEVKQDLKIDLAEPVDFKSVGNVAITTTLELSKIINDVFAQVFKDYYGCHLEVQFQPNRGYVIVPRLFFTVLKPEEYTDDAIVAFKPFSANTGDSILSRVQKISQASVAVSNSKVLMTDDAKSVLEDFVLTPGGKFDIKKFEWNTAYDVYPSEIDTKIRVFKLDINKFIKKIFGETDENGSPLFYQITPTFVVGASNQFKKGDNWAINILRLNQANEADAAGLLGFGIQEQSGQVIVTTRTNAQ